HFVRAKLYCSSRAEETAWRRMRMISRRMVQKHNSPDRSDRLDRGTFNSDCRGVSVSSLAQSRALAPMALMQNNAIHIAWQILLVAAGSALIAIAAHVKVPFWPVPATLQTLAIFTIAALYGQRLAVATVLAYLAEGAAGLPVFTGGAGLAYFAGPTTGYLAGFVVMAAITGWAADRGWSASPLKLLGANLV